MKSTSAPDGFRLAYDRRGAGPAVLLLHGWPGDRTDFSDVVPLLEADVVVPDLRGFGESDKHPEGPWTAAAQVTGLVALLDELGWSSAVVAGYDIGSRVAQTMAAQCPERVDALVVTPPVPGPGRRVLEPGPQAQFWYQSFHQLPLADELLDGRPDAVRAYLRHFWTHWSGPHFVPADARLDHLTARYAAPGAFAASIGWYRAGAGAVARALDETPPARRIEVPTTVLWPEFDPLFPRAWSDQLDEWFAAAQLQLVDGVGHFVPVEAPEVFAAAVAAAVARGR